MRFRAHENRHLYQPHRRIPRKHGSWFEYFDLTGNAAATAITDKSVCQRGASAASSLAPSPSPAVARAALSVV
jgi:hypothetical protein